MDRDENSFLNWTNGMPQGLVYFNDLDERIKCNVSNDERPLT